VGAYNANNEICQISIGLRKFLAISFLLHGDGSRILFSGAKKWMGSFYLRFMVWCTIMYSRKLLFLLALCCC